MKRITPIETTLSDKALLSVDEFRSYCGLGRNAALKLAIDSECRIIVGRRVLINRAKFDKWCENNSQ